MATVKSRWILNLELPKWSTSSLASSYNISGKIGDVTFSHIKGYNKGGTNEFISFYETSDGVAPCCRLQTPHKVQSGVDRYGLYWLSSDWVAIPMASIDTEEYSKWRIIEFYDDLPTSLHGWLTANATQQSNGDSTSGGATVAYNGSDLLSLEAGQTGTLNCAGTKMAGDVVVSFEGVGSVAYNGSVIASLSAGQSATLYCAGKKMAGNIVITCDGGGSN